MKRKCVECGRQRPIEDIHSVSRFGGGNWRRAGQWYSSSVCSECVLDLAPRAAHPRGHGNVGSMHWNTHGIMRAARRLGWQGPECAYSLWKRVLAELRA